MNLFVFIFLFCWLVGAFGYAIASLVDKDDPLGLKEIPLALMTLGLSLLGDKDIKKVFIKSGKPFSYNSYTFRKKPSGGYEMWDMGMGNWKTYKFVYGEPLNIKVVIPEEDRAINFNPYKFFKNINKPTKEELTLFKIEFNYDYKRCKKHIIELVN